MTKLRHVKWKAQLDPGANARRQLPRLMADYFALVRGLLKDDPAPPTLHAARLASKRVRYTLELFRPCYGPGFEARLDALRRLQQVLGDVNDAAATRRLLGEDLTGPLAAFLDARAEAKAGEFRKQWAEVFDAPGQLDWWIAYLSRYARTPGRR